MIQNKLTKIYVIVLLVAAPNLGYANDVGEQISATTDNGDKVILKPNGRWQYVDVKKAATAAKIAKEYPENKVCPPGSQGGWFGTKCILPGDKAFNRKSRIGK